MRPILLGMLTLALATLGSGGCKRQEEPPPSAKPAPQQPQVSEGVPAELHPSVTIDVARDSAAGYAFGAGWAMPERRPDGTTFRWSNGAESNVSVYVSAPPEGSVLKLAGNTIPGSKPQRVTISINDKVIGELSALSSEQDAELMIPPGVLRAGKNDIRLSYAWTQRPSETAPGSTDTRALALALLRMAIVPLPQAAYVLATLPANAHLLTGRWEGKEVVRGRTMAAVTGVGAIKVLMNPTGHRYWVQVTASTGRGAGELAVKVNGKDVGKAKLAETPGTVVMSIPEDVLITGANTIELSTGAPRLLVESVELHPQSAEVRIDVNDQDAMSYLQSGWSGREGSGANAFIWSNSQRSTVTFAIAPEAKGYRLTVVGRTVAPLKVNASLNGKSVGLLELGADFAPKTVDIPARLLIAGVNRLELTYSKTVKPPHDPRQLAVALQRLTLNPAP